MAGHALINRERLSVLVAEDSREDGARTTSENASQTLARIRVHVLMTSTSLCASVCQVSIDQYICTSCLDLSHTKSDKSLTPV